MTRIRSGQPSLLAVSALCLASLGCSRSPDDLREWRPSDHKHTSESSPESADQTPQVSGSAEAAPPGLDAVTIATWQRQCMTCHGQLGHGDGPQGPMVKARDLSDPAWQASVTDAQILESIGKGRGRMPAFPLPDATLEGLMHLVRLFNRDPSSAPASSAAPSANAAASGSAPAPAPSTR